MKIIRFTVDNKISYGLLNDALVQAIAGKPFGKIKTSGQTYRLNEVKLLAPCTPSKIVAIGLNYRSHAEEMKDKLPAEPLIFLKPPSAIIGHEDSIIYPVSSKQIDFEGELAVVIGEKARQVSIEEALSRVLGYTCFNDVTARDLQTKDGQWTRAKGFDTFAAVGPCIETELDPGNVTLETYLNGELRQRGSTGDLIFGVAEIISFISGIMTLLPGDIIATGTPGGIGAMSPGDTVEVKIAPVGTLRNYVVGSDG